MFRHNRRTSCHQGSFHPASLTLRLVTGGGFISAARQLVGVIARPVAAVNLASLLLIAGCGNSADVQTTANNLASPNSVSGSESAAANSQQEPANLTAVPATPQVRLVNAVAGADVPNDLGRDSISFISSSASNATPQAMGSTTLSWDGSTRNADGSNLVDLAGYRVYQGGASQLSIVQELELTTPGGRRSTTIADVGEQSNCFAVTAFDTANNESSLSGVTCVDLTSPPSPPAPESPPAAPGEPSPPSPDPSSSPQLPSAQLPAADLDLLPSEPPAPAPNLPTITAIAQIDSVGSLASIRISWLPPSVGPRPIGYSFYRGTQSQLSKVAEKADSDPTSTRQRVYDLPDVPGDQTCIAVTAVISAGNETALSNILCIALDTMPSAPSSTNQAATASLATQNSKLRPFNVSATNSGNSTAEVQWDRPDATRVTTNSAEIAAITSYDLYQGAIGRLEWTAQISETGEASLRRRFQATSVSVDNNCFAVAAIDEQGNQSALSETVCTASTDPTINDVLGVTHVTTLASGNQAVELSWDAPSGIVQGRDIANLSSYSLFQGTDKQLFRVAEIRHNPASLRQRTQRLNLDSASNCFALTALDTDGFESPLSLVSCVELSSTATLVSRTPIAPPTSLSTSAIGGSSTVRLSWVASGIAETGSTDPNLSHYAIFQGNRTTLSKIADVSETFEPTSTRSISISGVDAQNSCFALTAHDSDNAQSALSAVVCRDE